MKVRQKYKSQVGLYGIYVVFGRPCSKNDAYCYILIPVMFLTVFSIKHTRLVPIGPVAVYKYAYELQLSAMVLFISSWFTYCTRPKINPSNRHTLRVCPAGCKKMPVQIQITAKIVFLLVRYPTPPLQKNQNSSAS